MKIKSNNISNVSLGDIKMLSFNRNTSDSQVNKLLNSMSEHGKLRLPVLVRTSAVNGNKSLYCVDGQHMIKALKRNNEKSIYCIIFETEDLQEIVEVMATLNNVVQTWSIKDYVKAYASLSKPDYLVLMRTQESTGFSFKICAHILGSYSLVKKGKFISNKADSTNVIKYCTDVVTVLGSNKAHMLLGFIYFLRNDSSFNYKHKQMIDRLKKADVELLLNASPQTAQELFLQIYKS